MKGQIAAVVMVLATVFLPNRSNGGDPNTHFDGGFDTSLGWVVVGSDAIINTANSRLEFETSGVEFNDAYIYADLQGDPIIGDFELQVATYVRNTPFSPNPNAIVGGYADSIGKYIDWANGLCVTVDQNNATGRFFGLGNRINGQHGNPDRTYRITSFQWEFETWYYLSLKRFGTTATLEVYSDSGRTNMLGSTSLEDVTCASFQYAYAYSSAWACCSGEVISGYTDTMVEVSSQPGVEPPCIPAVSSWGLVVLGLLLLATGSSVACKRQHAAR